MLCDFHFHYSSSISLLAPSIGVMVRSVPPGAPVDQGDEYFYRDLVGACYCIGFGAQLGQDLVQICRWK